MIDFKEEIVTNLKELTNLETIPLEVPPDEKLGDYAFPCFTLSKTLKKSPHDIAEDLAKKYELSGSISKVKVVGPYLNFFIDKESLAYEVITEIQDKENDYGKSKAKKEKIMIEYSSPNTNKAQHLGHVRNNLLGATLANILEFAGYKVVRTCLMNDKGMGVSKTIYSYLNWHKDEKPNKKPDHYVADLYVEFQKKSTPELEEEATVINQKFEKGDKEIIDIWKKITGWVYEGYDKTYERLGCKFDKLYYESEIYTHGKEVVEEGTKKGIFKKDDGAIIADLESHKLPNKILIKSDGTSLYITQDLYLAELKEKDFKMDKSVYVVGSEQELHFKQLFKILELLGHKWAKKCHHLSYGMISLPSGKMKSREGTTVDADNLMDEMSEIAVKEINKRHKLQKKETEKRAEIIGVGAIKFHILKYEPNKGFMFDKEESISFEGETGPYIQYACARINSIFKKYGKHVPKKINYALLDSAIEQTIIKMLYNYEKTISDAAEQYKPSTVARYLLLLAQKFNEFYHANQILKEEKEKMLARLALIDSIKTVLESGLDLLGIKVLEEM